jgi:hypothetical protein
MIFDHDAPIGFGEGTGNKSIFTKPAALHRKPLNRTQLICRWHRSAQGPLTCTWLEVPSKPAVTRGVQLQDLPDDYAFDCGSRSESRLQTALRRIAITFLLTSAALGTVMCFITEASVLS